MVYVGQRLSCQANLAMPRLKKRDPGRGNSGHVKSALKYKVTGCA